MSSKKPKESPYLLRRVENGYMILDLSTESKPDTIWVAKSLDDVYSLVLVLGATSVEALPEHLGTLKSFRKFANKRLKEDALS
jgi:hypothetical protein